MCTVITYHSGNHYFGRNLDLDYSYNETVIIMPRHYNFIMRKMKAIESHYAIIGMATVVGNYPLFYDATNEEGLSMAGLNFPDYSYLNPYNESKDNVTSFEFIPYILLTCKNVKEARVKLKTINLYDEPFSKEYPNSTLHWMIADKEEAIVVESMKDGLHIYDNPVGVMTNNPPFNIMNFALNDYASLSPKQPENTFGTSLHLYSRGMGGLGLPGDLSSKSRFIKVAYTKLNSKSKEDENSAVHQFFKILGSVEQQYGLCEVTPGAYEYTIYSSCVNIEEGIYYYTTYNNSHIHGVNMHHTDLDASTLTIHKLIKDEPLDII
ncbi:choloylglycine hydrolase [Kandleria vitulina]|uniref:choloylglycine hydrolase n=1 Tax=Kandleria vitulina TaxID=1630 RepID=UPI00048EA236|nr:choloylglycine hydrolase [Kandleria vitulina]